MSVIAVSLKMYFDRSRTLSYCEEVARVARSSQEVAAGSVRLVVLPDFLTLDSCSRVLSGSPVILGAQDIATHDRGAYTGEVSGADLADLGVGCAEIGHAERRRLFGERDSLIAAKFAAALRNGLIPLLCVGDPEHIDVRVAAEVCICQVRAAVGARTDSEVWVAYEPMWSIGAPRPAPISYVAEVCRRIRAGVLDLTPNMQLIYGGAAGPGLLVDLGASVDGLFLGRFAHDSAALTAVVEEAADRVPSLPRP